MRSPLAAVVVVVLFGAMTHSARAEVTAEEVHDALYRGVEFLLEQQRDDGSWGDCVEHKRNSYPGGVTSLCTLALLSSGASPSEDEVQRSLKILRKIKPSTTYATSLQTMVFARAEPKKDRLLIERNVKWLESVQHLQGHCAGAWGYGPVSPRNAYHDNSNSQFALLALYEAERVGVVASDQTWRLAMKHWEEGQNEDGSWAYTKGTKQGTGSMTVAGISSLAIASDRLQQSGARLVGNHIDCCVAEQNDEAARIERAFKWLGKNFSVRTNPGNGAWLLYYLYGLERAGRLTAQRFIPLPARQGQPRRAGWYREGADFLVGLQDAHPNTWPRTDGDAPTSCSFMLLFLSKGRWPTLMAKLQYGGGSDWNHHRHDAANLTRYVETRWHRDLTWQVIELRLASVEDLLQTPVLYMCGSDTPLPEDRNERKELARKLRDYIDRGGFLLSEADCGCGDFDEGFRALMGEAFPEPEQQLQLLEAEHPIWYAEEKVDAQQMRPLWGIESGCRTSVVYVPPDPPQDPRPSLSCLWELSRPGRGVKYNPVVQEKIDAALSLGINVLAYATGRELKTKESFFRPATAPKAADKLERGRLYVVNLRHPGSCNVAPRALTNLMDSAGTELKLRTHVRPEPLEITDPSLFDYHLVFMHGRTAFRLTDGERRQLKQYLERGGMLFADSICTSPKFTESFRAEMAAIFPNRKLEPIPADDRLWGKKYGGFDLRTVSRRDVERGAGGMKMVVRKVAPELEGIKLGDRWGVVFSKYDLSCALEKHQSLGCRGYTQDDAARIGLNVIQYSLQQ
jgi:hypothetical protein